MPKYKETIKTKKYKNETDSSKRKDPEREKDQEKEKNFLQSQMIQRAGKAAIQKYFPNQIQLIQKGIREIQTDEKNYRF